MKNLFLALFCVVFFSVSAFAHQAFTLVSSKPATVKESDIEKIQKEQTLGVRDKSNLTFTTDEIRLVVITGPEDDMLSYRIQGIRNPNIVVPPDATLKILFVNVDGDMRHDVRFGHIMGDFPVAPEITETAGSQKLTAESEDEVYQAEEFTIKANEDGAYKYFCSVRGHAKGGMWGNILVGVKSGENLKTAPKSNHVHSADEDMETPTEKKPADDMSGMKMDGEKKSDPMSGMKMDDKKSDSMNGMDMSENGGMNNHGSHGAHNMKMSAVTNINTPMTQESSGTAWMPESTPMYARMKMFDDGSMLMFHGNMFLRYTNVGSKRDLLIAGKGDNARFDAPSMFMLMYSKPVSNKSQIGLRAMVSLDPLIERGYGYPLLYQSGESFRGQKIHDRQHPHDLFSELSFTFSHKFNDKQSMYFYAGYPGEPALGPPTFMHRMSAMNNPDAPISHHWQDSTHITYGVLTAGYVYDKFKFEASAFKGQEPDENRWDLDKPKLDSFSGRLSFNPTKEWAFQISYGYLKNPEPSEPNLKILRRTTASAIYNKRYSDTKNWANSFVWGQNYGNGERTNAFLYETNYDFNKNSVFGRLERAQKSGHELVLDDPDHEKIFWVGAYSAGYLREIYQGKNLNVGIGAQVTLYNNPASLVPYYGGTNHRGIQIFLRFRSSRMTF